MAYSDKNRAQPALMSFKARPKIHIQILFRNSNLDNEAKRWIARLRLKKHPEGGHFRETYRSELAIKVGRNTEERNVASAIYYVLAGKEFSAFHRLKSDEIWHHYAGGSLSLYVIKKGKMSTMALGKADRESPQLTIEKDCWIAASIKSGGFCLIGCTVSPGFDFRDWELGTRSQLIAAYPRHQKIITSHTIV